MSKLGYHITFVYQFIRRVMLPTWTIKQAAHLQPHQQALLAQIANIERLHFEDAWQLPAIKAVLAQFGAGLLLALDDKDRVLGYCVYQIVFEMAEILRIAVDFECQGQGIAKALIGAFVRLCQDTPAQKILLEVRADNAPALALYHSVGFEQLDRRKHYYHTKSGKMDALIMQKWLSVN